MTKRFICGIHDSPLTSRGTKRIKIYIGSCGYNAHEIRDMALKDFNSQKEPINQIEKIKPFKRTGTGTTSNDKQGKEIMYERQEWADMAFYHMRYIL